MQNVYKYYIYIYIYISYHKSYPFIFVSLTSGVQCIQKLSSEGIPDTGPVHFADVLGDRRMGVPNEFVREMYPAW